MVPVLGTRHFWSGWDVENANNSTSDNRIRVCSCIYWCAFIILMSSWNIIETISNCCFLSQNNLILASSYDFNLTNTHTRSSHFLSLQPHSQAVPQPPASPDCVSPNVLGLPQLGFPGLFPVPAMAPPSSLWKFLSVKTPCLSLLQGALLWPFSSHSHTHTFMHTHRLHYTITKPLRWDLSCTAVSRLWTCLPHQIWARGSRDWELISSASRPSLALGC